MISSPKQMLNELFERQAAIQTQVDKYASTRKVFEGFLEAGQKLDDGPLWLLFPGDRNSRYNWRRQELVATPDGRKVVIKAFTNPRQYRFGREAGDIRKTLIEVKVSSPENPTVVKELELPPVWAILEQNSDFSPRDLNRLEKDLEEIVPLVRACLPQKS